MGAIVDFLIHSIVWIVVNTLGRYTWIWWALAAGLLTAAVARQSWPFAIGAAIVVIIRLVFAWLETLARAPLVDPEPGQGRLTPTESKAPGRKREGL